MNDTIDPVLSITLGDSEIVNASVYVEAKIEFADGDVETHQWTISEHLGFIDLEVTWADTHGYSSKHYRVEDVRDEVQNAIMSILKNSYLHLPLELQMAYARELLT